MKYAICIPSQRLSEVTSLIVRELACEGIYLDKFNLRLTKLNDSYEDAVNSIKLTSTCSFPAEHNRVMRKLIESDGFNIDSIIHRIDVTDTEKELRIRDLGTMEEYHNA